MFVEIKLFLTLPPPCFPIKLSRYQNFGIFFNLHAILELAERRDSFLNAILFSILDNRSISQTKTALKTWKRAPPFFTSNPPIRGLIPLKNPRINYNFSPRFDSTRLGKSWRGNNSVSLNFPFAVATLHSPLPNLRRKGGEGR